MCSWNKQRMSLNPKRRTLSLSQAPKILKGCCPLSQGPKPERLLSLVPTLTSLAAGLTPSLLAVLQQGVRWCSEDVSANQDLLDKLVSECEAATLSNLRLHSWGLPLPRRGRMEAVELHRLASSTSGCGQGMYIISSDASRMKGHLRRGKGQIEGRAGTKKSWAKDVGPRSTVRLCSRPPRLVDEDAVWADRRFAARNVKTQIALLKAQPWLPGLVRRMRRRDAFGGPGASGNGDGAAPGASRRQQNALRTRAWGKLQGLRSKPQLDLPAPAFGLAAICDRRGKLRTGQRHAHGIEKYII